MGISIGHLIIILVIVLLVMGPSRLEGIGSGLGKAIKGFKKGIEDEDSSKTKKDDSKDSDEKKV
jgi:sec-independent protein translocase protein TatA